MTTLDQRQDKINSFRGGILLAQKIENEKEREGAFYKLVQGNKNNFSVKSLDLNNDGRTTPEEALKALAQQEQQVLTEKEVESHKKDEYENFAKKIASPLGDFSLLDDDELAPTKTETASNETTVLPVTTIVSTTTGSGSGDSGAGIKVHLPVLGAPS